ncbi:hypothetical protein UACE39S_01427 [Ureibacillus acetophenoni]
MSFPNLTPSIKRHSDYATSGITQTKLLEEAIDTRRLLVQELKELPTDVLVNPTTVNGVTHDSLTGTPYSLIYIIKEFIEHDEHHKRQIVLFLEGSYVD